MTQTYSRLATESLTSGNINLLIALPTVLRCGAPETCRSVPEGSLRVILGMTRGEPPLLRPPWDVDERGGPGGMRQRKSVRRRGTLVMGR